MLHQSPDWVAIYAAHGSAMKLAATAVLTPYLSADGEVFGKSADDLVGDVLADLMATGNLPEEPTNLRGFLTTAVRREAIDLLRRTTQLRKERHYPGPPFDHVAEAVEHQVLRAAAVAALDGLPSKERDAIVQRVMLERPAKDVGPELGVTPQRVSQLVSQGLGRLRQLPAFIDSLPSDHPPARSTTSGQGTTGQPA